MREPISAAVLHDLLEYNQETGFLVWKVRDCSLFQPNTKTAKHQAAIWNARYAGKAALTAKVHGYAAGKVFDVQVKAHRVIWAMKTGEWPDGEIDHINGVRGDNRWCNLRHVQRSINARNAHKSSLNTSGINGVSWHKPTSRWRAYLRVDYRQVHIGYFDNIEDASAARRAAEMDKGFTKRHGL